MKNRRSLHLSCVSSISILLLLAWALGACRAPAPAPMLSPVPAAERAVLLALTKAPEPTKMPAPMKAAPTQPPVTSAPAAVAARPVEQAASTTGIADIGVSSSDGIRKIIKNGEMNLLVADIDRALDQVTNIAVDSGGYIISSQVAMRGDLKVATLNLGVPVEQFEAVQRQLRSIAAKVVSETASGKDVTDEYVDLQSRLANLEATAARVREFLKQAQTVDEALKVNAQLTEIEGQINQVKGRMNFLRDRSAFSTLLVNLEPVRLTPTPTATLTPTPTPTPVAWRPDETFKTATGILGSVLQWLGDLLIWAIVLIGPILVVAAAIIIVTLWLRQRRRHRAG